MSDVVAPLPSLQLAYGCTLQFSPEVCNHWAVGEGEGDRAVIDNNAPPGWWDFLFRVPMNGQFGISSRVAAWSPALKQRAAENVALYKRIRRTIAGADAYHLTPPPSRNDPQDWMAIQYVSENRDRSIVMAYRLRNGAAERSWTLHGLEPDEVLSGFHRRSATARRVDGAGTLGEGPAAAAPRLLSGGRQLLSWTPSRSRR